MNSHRQRIIIASILIALVSGCAVNQAGQVRPDPNVFSKDKVIPLGGGLLGAVICNQLFEGHGSRDSWTAICGVAGYFASTAFMQQHNQALESNRVGETAYWKDPDGSSHSLTPTKTYNRGNLPCRDFRQTVEIDGQIEVMEGRACRQRDGTWKLVS